MVWFIRNVLLVSLAVSPCSSKKWHSFPKPVNPKWLNSVTVKTAGPRGCNYFHSRRVCLRASEYAHFTSYTLWARVYLNRYISCIFSIPLSHYINNEYLQRSCPNFWREKKVRFPRRSIIASKQDKSLAVTQKMFIFSKLKANVKLSPPTNLAHLAMFMTTDIFNG